MHIIHVYPIPKRGERIEIACPSSRVCVRAETGWERTERDEQVKGRRPRTSIHTHRRIHPPRERAEREGRRGGVGKEDTAEGFITRDLLLLPGGGGPLHNGQRRCIRRGVCLSDTCSSRTHTRICCARARVCGGTQTHGYGAHRWDEPTSVHPIS